MTARQMIPGEPWPVVPAPATTSTAAWWDATREQHLLVQSCDACGHVQLYPRALCTGCGATDAVVMVATSGRATVVSHTTIHRAPDPRMAVPYVVAIVQLDEGPRLLTRLWHPDADVATTGADLCDVPCTVAWALLDGDDRQLPVFLPEL